MVPFEVTGGLELVVSSAFFFFSLGPSWSLFREYQQGKDIPSDIPGTALKTKGQMPNKSHLVELMRIRHSWICENVLLDLYVLNVMYRYIYIYIQ